MNDSTLSKDAVVVERIFDAPVDLIWQMWVQPEHFKNWYGPQGFTVPVAEMDVRVGGQRLVCMEMQTPEGSMKMWTVGEYTEIVPNQRLVYTESPADENGNIVSPSAMGMPDGYPATTEVIIQLEDLGGRTKMVMTHAGVPAESGAGGGWEQAFAKLADYVGTVLKGE
ncbi:MAG: ATPase [Anaerolineaceae bacterium]|nr:ATPase [Anaerolineaceae bacterium]